MCSPTLGEGVRVTGPRASLIQQTSLGCCQGDGHESVLEGKHARPQWHTVTSAAFSGLMQGQSLFEDGRL